jgi:ABC-type multidrug transport system fused ATPase/permease subunit
MTAANTRKFRLKTIVLVRAFAEMTVLIVLIAAPLALLIAGKLLLLPRTAQIVLWVAEAVSLGILPWFGFITYQVTTSDTGLNAIALFLKQSCSWNQIKALSRRSTHNWSRYVVELESNSELTFPLVLESCDELVAQIRAHLPAQAQGASRANLFRSFRTDPIAILFQFLQAFAGMGFISICWLFCASVVRTTNMADTTTIVAFCVATSAVLGWRTWMVSLMPKAVQLDPAQLTVRTLFFERRYGWDEIISVKPPFPLLPEGFILKTKKGSYLVGTGMNAADELQETVNAKIAKGSS